MGEWWEDEAPLVKVEPKPLAKPERLKDIEDQIHEEAASVIQGALRFADIDPNDEEPPSEWVAELGYKKAMARFRLAKFALLNPKEAPIGLRIAKDTLVGMAKARAREKSGPKTLNMVVVQMTGSLPRFEELEVDK